MSDTTEDPREKRMRMRNKAVSEIVSTEQSYVDALNVVLEGRMEGV